MLACVLNKINLFVFVNGSMNQVYLDRDCFVPSPHPPTPIFKQEVKLSLEHHISCLEKALDCVIV